MVKRKFVFALALISALTGMTAFAQETGWQWNETERAWYYYQDAQASASGTAGNSGTSAVTGANASGTQSGDAANSTNAADGAAGTGASSSEQGLFTGWVQDNGSWYYIKNSRMQTGWVYVNGAFYFLKADGKMAENEWSGNFYCGPDGAVLTNTTTPDGTKVDENGSRIVNGTSAEPATPYLSVIKQYPDFFAVFGEGNHGGFRISIENGKYCYKTMEVYAENLDETGSGKMLFSGDGFINLNTQIQLTAGDWRLTGTKKTISFSSFYIDTPRFRAKHCQFNPAGYITYIERS